MTDLETVPRRSLGEQRGGSSGDHGAAQQEDTTAPRCWRQRQGWCMSPRRVHPSGPQRNVSAVRRALRPRYSALSVWTVDSSGADSGSGGGRGRPPKLEPAVVTHLAGIVMKLCSRLAVSAPTLNHVVDEALARVDVDTQWGVGTVRTFAHKLGRSFKHAKRALHTKLTPDEQHDVRTNCREKIESLMSESGIADRARVLNKDETATRLMSTSSRGWLPKTYVRTETRRQVATMVACQPVCGKLCGQVILQGTTDAVVPCVPQPDNIGVEPS